MAASRRLRWRCGARGSRAVLLLLCCVALLTSAGTAQVWTNLQAISVGYKLSIATRARARLIERNRQLRVELALLKRPARVAKVVAALGFRHPEPDQMRRLTDQRSRPARRALRPEALPQPGGRHADPIAVKRLGASAEAGRFGGTR